MGHPAGSAPDVKGVADTVREHREITALGGVPPDMHRHGMWTCEEPSHLARFPGEGREDRPGFMSPHSLGSLSPDPRVGEGVGRAVNVQMPFVR